MSLSQAVRGLGGGLAALGVRVDKPSADIPVSPAVDGLFVITHGKILLTSLIGQVTKEISAGPDLAYVQHLPTTGAVTAIPLCDETATALDIDGAIVGEIFIITGLATDAMQLDEGAGVWIASMGTNQVILQPGTIGWTCDSTNTGKVKWVMHYVALDPGSVVSPA